MKNFFLPPPITPTNLLKTFNTYLEIGADECFGSGQWIYNNITTTDSYKFTITP